MNTNTALEVNGKGQELFVEKFKITVNGMEHEPTTEGTDDICQEVPVITNSIGRQIVLNEFDSDGIDNGDYQRDDSDFIEQKGEAPLFDESEHNKIHEDRKNKGVSQFVCRNSEQGLRLEPAVTGSAEH